MSKKLQAIEESIDSVISIVEVQDLRRLLDNYRRAFTASPASGTPEIARLYQKLEKKEKELVIRYGLD